MSTSWNSITDFSTASNPNGVWSYMGGAESAPYLLSVQDRAEWEGTPITGYAGSVPADQGPFPYIALNPTDDTIDYGNTAFVPPHSMVLHPALNGDEAILRWTAPITGTYTIQGSWERNDFSIGGNGTLDSIYDNGNLLGTTYLPPDSYGTELPFNHTVSLSAGDTLDFVVDSNGDYFFDSTGLGLTISNPTGSTWTDSTGNHKASDPNNWSSGTAPQPGDNLFVPGGSTLDIRDNNLQGNPLNLAGSVTLNMSSGARVAVNDINNGGSRVQQGAPVVANVRGHGTLSVDVGIPHVPFQFGAPVTVNLGDHATLDGTFHMQQTSLAIAGGDHAKFINDGDTLLDGVHAVIGVDVVGTGGFVVGAAATAPSPTARAQGSLEFGGRVSRGQFVDVFGDATALTATRLVIDRPHEFHATVGLHDVASLADLVGLAEADHWSYANDVLSISNVCGKVIDKLHVLIDEGASSVLHGLSVHKTTDGDVIVGPGMDFSGSLALPTS